MHTKPIVVLATLALAAILLAGCLPAIRKTEVQTKEAEGQTPSPIQSPTPEPVVSVAPTVPPPTAAPATLPACPPIEVEVTISIYPVVLEVGDTFTVTCRSSGFAGLADISLYAGDSKIATASHDPDQGLLIYDDVPPLIQVLPTSWGSSLGHGEFFLLAMEPGLLDLHVEIYGDAWFSSRSIDGQCFNATQFERVSSSPVTVTILPPEESPVPTPEQ